MGDDRVMAPLEPLMSRAVLSMLIRFVFVLACQNEQLVALAPFLVLGEGMFVFTECLFFQSNGRAVLAQGERVSFK